MNYPGRYAYEGTQVDLSSAYLISGFALLVVGLIQLWVNDRKVAKWNIAFAFTALCCGYLLNENAPYIR